MKRSTVVLRLVAFCLAVLATGAARDSHAFLVSGFVRNAQGQGIAGVDIDAENAATGEDVPLSNDGTAANGFYAVFVPPGTYHLRFTPPMGQPLVAKEQQNVAVMNQVSLSVTLPNGFFLFGTVRTPALAPIAGVDIDVRDQVTDAKLFVPHDDTDAAGFYSVVLPAGTYKVLFRPQPSTSFPVRVFEQISVTQDRNLDCTLQNGVRLFGTTRDPSGAPLAGVALDVFNAANGAKVWTFGSTSDAAGAYQAALLPGLTYNLRYIGPSGWGYQTASLNAVLITANTQRDVNLGFPFRVRGHVQAAQGGAPVPNVKVIAVNVANEHEIPFDNDTTDGSGDYEVQMPAGTYDIIFRSPEGNGLASWIARGVVIDDDTDVNMTLPPGVALSGRVTQPGGAGVPNVDFDIENAANGLSVAVFDDDTDATGNYTLVLPAGTYNLAIDPGRGVRFVGQELLGVVVPHAGSLNVQLAAGVLLSGLVIDHVSNPWPDIDLDVRIANTVTEIMTPGDDTDAAGHYLVTVPPGTYDLVFNVPPGIPVTGRTFEDVVVGPGDTVFDAVLASTVIGVAEAEAMPAAGVRLEPPAPNPFNPFTRIAFTLDAGGPAVLRIYDVSGHAVRTLVDGRLPAGRQAMSWDGRDDRGTAAASGVYFLRLETTAGTAKERLVLLR